MPLLDITQNWYIYHSRTRQCQKKSTCIYTILGSHRMRSLSGTYTIARINPKVVYLPFRRPSTHQFIYWYIYHSELKQNALIKWYIYQTRLFSHWYIYHSDFKQNALTKRYIIPLLETIQRWYIYHLKVVYIPVQISSTRLFNHWYIYHSELKQNALIKWYIYHRKNQSKGGIYIFRILSTRLFNHWYIYHSELKQNALITRYIYHC